MSGIFLVNIQYLMYSFIFPPWKNIIASGDTGSCWWCVLWSMLLQVAVGRSLCMLIKALCTANREGSVLINRDKVSCSAVFPQDMERDTSYHCIF